MRIIISIVFSLSAIYCQAQVPQVPSRIDFGNMKLKLTEGARIDIQRDVNNLHKSPKYFDIKAERARTFFPIIERIFKKEGIPDEIKYLVLQESALISDAVSSANAVGFWQQKDFTAMELGLRVDRNIDERKNIVSSTYAAARYLNKANQTFENWLYSVQSYQMGIGGASRTLPESNYGKTNMTISRQTYWYVKKFLAYMIAFENYVDQKPSQEITEYLSGKGKSLHEIARETGFSEDKLKEMNKWLMRGKIPDDRFYVVILPGAYETKTISLSDEKVEKKRFDLPPISSQTLIFPKLRHDKFKDHKYIIGVNGLPGIVASSTDNAQSLAQKGNISNRKFNLINDLDSKHSVKPGQVYYLKKKKNKAGTHYHTLQRDETLWDISQKYGIKLDKLLTKNRIGNPDKVKPGRVLWLRYIRPEEIAISYSKIDKSSPGIDEDASKIITETTTLRPATKAEKDERSETIQEIEKPIVKIDTKEFENENQDLKKKKEKGEKQNISEESELEDLNGKKLENDKKNTPIKPTQSDKTIDKIQPGKDSEDYPDAEILYPTSGKRMVIHKIVKGETFYSISKMYSIPVPALLQWNDMDITEIIYIGQQLKVYIDATNPSSRSHIVQKGETLYKIARQYGVTVDELLEWNDKMDYHLKIGETLKINNPR